MLVASLTLAGQVQAEGAATAQLAVEPAGYATYPIPSKAVGFDYYLSATSSIGLNYARGSGERLLAESAAELALLRYKLYFGSTMHLALGAGYRSLGYKQTVQTTTGEAEATTEMEVIVGEASFGNQIRFGPAMIGCDWVGIAVPMKRLKLTSDFPDDAAAGEEQANEDATLAVAFVPTLQFMRVYVGAVF